MIGKSKIKFYASSACNSQSSKRSTTTTTTTTTTKYVATASTFKDTTQFKSTNVKDVKCMHTD